MQKKRKPLMVELNKETERKFAQLYKDIDHGPLTLKEIANIAGGYQSHRRYPKIKAKPIGVCVAVVYRTIKKTDGLTNYIHSFGEPYLSKEKWSQKPNVAIAKNGEIFFCGGNYKCEIEGIIN